MHAASGSCALFVAVMLDLNDEQLCQARLTDYAIAFSRTVAVSFNFFLHSKRANSVVLL